MRENSELTNLFKNRLSQTEMEVRDGFWETLEQDLSKSIPAVGRERRGFSSRMHRWMVAASVLLVLVAATLVWWSRSPQEAGEEVPVAPLLTLSETPEAEEGVSASVEEASVRPIDPVKEGGTHRPVLAKAVAQAEPSPQEPMSVHVSITITQRQYGYPSDDAGRRRRDPMSRVKHEHWTEDGASWSASGGEEASVEDCAALLKTPRWFLKASAGTSLPKGNYQAPFEVGLGVERRLNKRLSLEAGLQYVRLHEDGGETLHTLGIPVRLNVLLAGNSKVDLYALAGGAVEKCVGGAPDNGFEAEPVQCSVMAGMGVRYKMNDRLALFVEPTVTHHFDTDSSTRSLYSERPTNLNLSCGLRMAF